MNKPNEYEYAYAGIRKRHLAKRDNITALSPPELLLRRAILRCERISVIEFEHEVYGVRDTGTSILWFDALVLILSTDHQPLVKGLIDLYPRHPRGREVRILEEKIQYAAANDIPLCQTDADSLTDWRVKSWARKIAREHDENSR